MKSTRLYSVKYIISGDIIEKYTYQKRQKLGTNSNKNTGKNSDGLNTEKNRAESLSNARKKVMRTINANRDLNKFLTLTFEECVTDLDYSNNELKKFIKRLNYRIFKTKKSLIKYIAVIEFQDGKRRDDKKGRGAVHYHMLLNIPYVDVSKIEQLWTHGFVKLNKIKGDKKRFGSSECDNVGAYVCKYMTKDNDDDRLRKRKSYLMSRNLNKSEIVYFENEKKDLLQQVYSLDSFDNSSISSSYINEYTGLVLYNQYNLKRIKNQSKK